MIEVPGAITAGGTATLVFELTDSHNQRLANMVNGTATMSLRKERFLISGRSGFPSGFPKPTRSCSYVRLQVVQFLPPFRSPLHHSGQGSRVCPTGEG